MEVVHSNDAPAAIGPYVQGIKIDGMFYSSGQIPLKADGTLVQGGIVEQTEQVFANLRAVLAAAGASLSDVVKTTVFVKDLGDFPKLNEAYGKAFGDHKPARSTVQVARLPLDVAVEIEVIAKLK